MRQELRNLEQRIANLEERTSSSAVERLRSQGRILRERNLMDKGDTATDRLRARTRMYKEEAVRGRLLSEQIDELIETSVSGGDSSPRLVKAFVLGRLRHWTDRDWFLVSKHNRLRGAGGLTPTDKMEILDQLVKGHL